jgi:hypothetical protein
MKNRAIYIEKPKPITVETVTQTFKTEGVNCEVQTDKIEIVQNFDNFIVEPKKQSNHTFSPEFDWQEKYNQSFNMNASNLLDSTIFNLKKQDAQQEANKYLQESTQLQSQL